MRYPAGKMSAGLPVAEALEIAGQIASGLATAHTAASFIAISSPATSWDGGFR
jgi:hypothetical protein